MKYPSFESFLMDKWQEEVTGTEMDCLDDDSPDVFNAWLECQHLDDIIAWGDLYGNKMAEIAINNLNERLTKGAK